MGKTVFMFPGQGAQTVGMLRDIYEQYPVFHETIKQAENALNKNLEKIIFEGPPEELNLTVNTQPIMLAVEYGMFRIMSAHGIIPDYLAGFSLGEWTAAVAAQVISFEDALRLVVERAKAMQQAVPVGEGAMAVIMGRDVDYISSLCSSLGEYAAPSNYNYPGQITVSGTANAIEQIRQKGEIEGFVVNLLPVSIPSHCELMKSAAQMLEAIIYESKMRDALFPLIMNVDARPVFSADIIRENLISQMTKPVLFEQSVKYLLKDNVDTFIELGPGKTLAGFVRKTSRAEKASVLAVRTDSVSDLQSALSALKEKEK